MAVTDLSVLPPQMAMASSFQGCPGFNPRGNKQGEAEEKEAKNVWSYGPPFRSSGADLSMEAGPRADPEDRRVLLSLIKWCGKERSLAKVRNLHAEIAKKAGSLAKDVYMATALLNAYASCGSMGDAERLLDEIARPRNVVTWTALMGGYVKLGWGDKALECYSRMRSDGVEPDNVTYLCILKACGLAKDVEKGAEIESEIRKRGLLARDVALGNALVGMLARCGSLSKARDAFDALPVRDAATWNTLIGGYGQTGRSEEALECFARMREEGSAAPDAVTFTAVLKACASAGALRIGEAVDAEARRRRLVAREMGVATSLVGMYARCGAPARARELLGLMPERDAASWTALMSGYAARGHAHAALGCLQEMAADGISPDAVAYACALKACGIVGSLEAGRRIGAELVARGLLDCATGPLLGNALVAMYARCGALESAEDAFGRLSLRDAVSWNALLSGYAHCGRSEEALRVFRRMRSEERVRPDQVTYACALRACSLLGSLELGEQIAAEVHRRRLLLHTSTAALLGNALVDMYAKCGAPTKAQEAFERLPVRDVVAWNALAAGYAQLGRADAVLGLLRELRANGVAPNAVTFLASLTACSHAGLVREGQTIFASLYHATLDDGGDGDGGGDDDDDDDDDDDGGIIVFPSPQHYTCMVDLFVRAGRFDDAAALLGQVPGSDHLPLFLAVLGACQRWPTLEPVARWAFEQSVRVDDTCGAPYVCMENIYAAAIHG